MKYNGDLKEVGKLFSKAVNTYSIEMQLPSKIIHIFQTQRYIQKGPRYFLKHIVPEMICIGDEIFVDKNQQLKVKNADKIK